MMAGVERMRRRGGSPISFLCVHVTLIHWMMKDVERIRRKVESDIFPVSSSKVDTLDDGRCRKNEKEGGSDIFPVSSSKVETLDDRRCRKNEKEGLGTISFLFVHVTIIHYIMA